MVGCDSGGSLYEPGKDAFAQGHEVEAHTSQHSLSYRKPAVTDH